HASKRKPPHALLVVVSFGPPYFMLVAATTTSTPYAASTFIAPGVNPVTVNSASHRKFWVAAFAVAFSKAGDTRPRTVAPFITPKNIVGQVVAPVMMPRSRNLTIP